MKKAEVQEKCTLLDPIAAELTQAVQGVFDTMMGARIALEWDEAGDADMPRQRRSIAFCLARARAPARTVKTPASEGAAAAAATTAAPTVVHTNVSTDLGLLGVPALRPPVLYPTGMVGDLRSQVARAAVTRFRVRVSGCRYQRGMAEYGLNDMDRRLSIKRVGCVRVAQPMGRYTRRQFCPIRGPFDDPMDARPMQRAALPGQKYRVVPARRNGAMRKPGPTSPAAAGSPLAIQR
jgi:hypothetical protein